MGSGFTVFMFTEKCQSDYAVINAISKSYVFIYISCAHGVKPPTKRWRPRNSVFQTPMTFERLISKAEYLHKLLVGFTKGIRLGCWNVWNIRYESPRFVMFALHEVPDAPYVFLKYRYASFSCASWKHDWDLHCRNRPCFRLVNHQI